MIGYFPKAHPDELLYSICARCFDHMGYPSKQVLVQELFGTRSVLASIELPSHLDQLITALPEGHNYTADQLIDDYTLLPFYGPFLPPSRLDDIRQDMHGNNWPTIHMRAGIMASRVPLPRWLRYCPMCVNKDKEEYGECYWHRVHQVPGVEVCPFHKVYLQNSNVSAQNRATRYEFVSAKHALQQMVLQEPVSLNTQHDILLRIALDAQWLLHQHRLSHELQSVYRRYTTLLADPGLSTYRGRILNGELLQKFKSSYSSDILELLGCKIDERVNENWLLRLVRKPDNAQHPLHHMLLIHFLGHTVESFFNFSTASQPFGKGPWPCLNPASNHYQQCQIQQCQVEYSEHVHGRPIGIFSCICGFIYSRTGPDVFPEDRYKLSKVQSFGSIWEERLRLLWKDETVSLRGIAKQLGVDPLTVKRHATRLGLLFPRPIGRCQPLKKAQQLHTHEPSVPDPSKVEFYRMVWQATMKEDPQAGMMILRKRVPKVYSWLYRHDRTWLKGHSTSHSSKKVQHYYTPVDWKSRDVQISEAVNQSVVRLRTSDGRPSQITISAIGRNIGQLALLQQHLDKLPLTANCLAGLVETREMFAVRRINWAIEQFKHEKYFPTRWQLIIRAGVERLVTCTMVKETLDAALQELIN